MVLFKDISKAATDLLQRDFPHDKIWEVEARSVADNFLFTQQASSVGSGNLDTCTQVRFANKDLVVESKIFRSGLVTVDAKYTNDLAPGILGNVRVDSRRSGKASTLFVEVASELNQKNVHGRVAFQPNGRVLVGSALFNVMHKFKIGGEAQSNLELKKISYSLGGSYGGEKSSKMAASIKTLPDGTRGIGKLQAQLHCQSGPTEVAADLVYPLGDVTKSVLTFGGKHKFDKFTHLKCRVASDGKVSTALTHRLSSILSGSVGCQVDATGVDEGVKCGFKLYLNH